MRTRPSTRLLVIDPLKRVLLFKGDDDWVTDPSRPFERDCWWATPGGGVEDGETFEQAGLRELWEETGIRLDQLGAQVWERQLVLLFKGEPFQAHERYFVANVPISEVSLENMEEVELELFRGYHWWTLDELAQTDEAIFPLNFASLIAPILNGQLPQQPINLELI